MTKCQVSISAKQIYQDHIEKQDQSFQGKLSRKNKSTYIIYKEKCQDASITNQVKVCQEGRVSVRRMGGHKSLLHFAKDKPYTTFYDTGQGSVELTFKPISIKCSETDKGYTIDLKYDIYMGGQKLSGNEYSLKASYQD